MHAVCYNTYDSTHTYHDSSEYGYFLYVDASDEARPICSVEFDADMCAGATLVCSALINEMSGGDQRAEMMFDLYGVETDDYGNQVALHKIQSFDSAALNTTSDFKQGTWMQTYGKTVLRSGSNVENYDHYLMQISNYANGTNGADYALDDIRIYTSKFKLDASTSNVVCTTDGSEDSWIEVRMAEASVADILETGATDVIIVGAFYEDGTPYDLQYTASDGTVYPFMWFTINGYTLSGTSGEFSSGGAEFDEETGELITPGYYYGEDGTLYYYFYEGYITLPSEAIYFSMAEVGTTVDAALAQWETYEETGVWDSSVYWGPPSDNCSVHTTPLTARTQYMELTAGLDSSGNIVFDCDEENTIKSADLVATIYVPQSDGSILEVRMEDVQLDWIIVEKEYYDLNKSDVTELANAVQGYRRDYYYATDKIDERTYLESPYNAYSKDSAGDAIYFSDTDWQLINAHIGNEDYESDETGSTETDMKNLIETGGGAVYLRNGNETLPKFPVTIGNSYYCIAIARYSQEQKVLTGYTYTYDSNGAVKDSTAVYTTVMICDDLMTSLITTRFDGPEIYLGFEDVNYPSDWDGAQTTIRLGINQLQDIQSHGNYHIHIPVLK